MQAQRPLSRRDRLKFSKCLDHRIPLLTHPAISDMWNMEEENTCKIRGAIDYMVKLVTLGDVTEPSVSDGEHSYPDSKIGQLNFTGLGFLICPGIVEIFVWLMKIKHIMWQKRKKNTPLK